MRASSLLSCWCLATAVVAEAAGTSVFDLSLESLLETEVVTATRSARPLARVPATVLVVTAEQIRARGYRYLDEALRDLPGLDAVHVHGAYPTIWAPRGAWGDENRRLLLLIDGVDGGSINGGFELGGPAYSLHDVGRIELVLGPGSALYGANAYSGIIQIFTRQGLEASGFEAEAGIGTESTRFANFAYHGGGEGFSFSLSGSRYSSEGWRFERQHPDFSAAYVDGAYSLSGQALWQEGPVRTRIGAQIHDTPMGDGEFGATPSRRVGSPPVGRGDTGLGGYLNFDVLGGESSRWHPYRRALHLEHERPLTTQTSAFARASLRETGIRDDSFSYSYNAASDAFFNFHGVSESRRRQLELRTVTALDTAELSLGLDYYADDAERGFRAVRPDPRRLVIDGLPYTNLEAPFASRVGVQSHNTSLYAQYQRELESLGGAELTLGARYDRHSLYGSGFNPRLGLVGELWPGWSAKLLYGTAFRAPTSFELYSSSPVRVPNPGLEPERLRSLELGLSYQGARHSWQWTAFDNRLDEVITDGVPVAGGKFQVRNAGTARIHGGEVQFGWEPAEAWQCYANLSWQSGRQDGPQGGFEMPNIAEWKLNTGLSHGDEGLGRLSLALNAVGERSVAPTNPLGEVGGYAIARLSYVSPALWQARLSWRLVIDNVLDREYVDPGIKQADGQTFGTALDQPGRTAWLSLSLRL